MEYRYQPEGVCSYEMIFEMEVPAFLYNFGVIGFFLYFMPFLAIAMYGTYMAVKKIKNIKKVVKQL